MSNIECSDPHTQPMLEREKVHLVQDQYFKALQIHLSQSEESAALGDILNNWLPKLHKAAFALLHSRMLYVPFLMCSSALRSLPQPSAMASTSRSKPPSTSSASSSIDVSSEPHGGSS